MKDKKKIILSVLGILMLVVVTVGVTFAVFTYTKLGTTENTVTTGTLKFLYTENTGVGAGINIENAFPVSDTVGKSYDTDKYVFDFSVEATNSGSEEIPYEVTLRKKSTSTLSESNVKVYLTDMTGDADTSIVAPTLYSDLIQTTIDVGEETEKTIYNGVVLGGELDYLKDFRLRMWIDETSNQDDINGKTFTALVNVYSNVPLVSEEEMNSRNETSILSISAEDTIATKVEDKDYDYELRLDSGLTSTIINVETVNESATVEVEKVDSLTHNSNVRKIALSKTIDLVDGNNYFKIKVKSENKEKTDEYILKVVVGKESINTLDSLSVGNCTLSPAFSSSANSYTCDVDYDITKVTVNADVTSDYATYEVETPEELVVGVNTIKVIVTAEDGTKNTYKIEVTRKVYTEAILNGTDPVVKGNLVPVIISDTGKVTKANTDYEWYSYADKEWANAVILKDETVEYENGATIPESNIESYFVWIPRYKYKIFNTGNYTSLTSFTDKTQTIEVIFENKNTTASNGTTVGSYLTHPAFTSFDSNGMWVGKFETGYDGATSTTGAEVNSVNTSKIVIKPNVYSWRSITTGNMFKNSYDYQRSLDSHMMKNTEWGAVAYLQHSSYGSATSVRINNNSAFITGYSAKVDPTKGYYSGNSTTSIDGNRSESTSLGVDGTYTVNYLNPSSQVSSTTGNYTGIYDMSGGTWESMMGYTTKGTTDNSGITTLYSNFFSDTAYTKYRDEYTSSTITDFNSRILGDATGEMGPFGTFYDPAGNQWYISSWYKDYGHFILSAEPWIYRSGHWRDGVTAGVFTFMGNTGLADYVLGYRIVLTPNN